MIDANNRLYCPGNVVSRGQVAAFLERSFDMPDTGRPDVGTIAKPSGAFLHNFDVSDTFLGVGAGNFSMTGTSTLASESAPYRPSPAAAATRRSG